MSPLLIFFATVKVIKKFPKATLSICETLRISSFKRAPTFDGPVLLLPIIVFAMFLKPRNSCELIALMMENSVSKNFAFIRNIDSGFLIVRKRSETEIQLDQN